MKFKWLIILTILILTCTVSCDQIPTYPINQDAEIEAAIIQTAVIQMTDLAYEPESFATVTVMPEDRIETEAIQDTATPIPEDTPIPVYRDIALLHGAVSMGEGTAVFPGERFDVIWRIRNVGETTWTGDYQLVLVSGDAMGVPKTIPLLTQVEIGEIIEVRLKLTAPEVLGDYTALWLFENADGELFGVDDAGEKPLEVGISVIDNPIHSAYRQIFKFYENFSTADWYTQNGIALCEAAGNVGEFGLVYRDNAPVIQAGVVENEPSIVMIPAEGAEGYIAGKYPPFEVKAGDYFVTFIGCLDKGTLCDVTFRLDYQVVGAEEVLTFAEWRQTHTGKWEEIRKNLTKLDGLEVQFILVVENNGYARGDYAVWFVPAIYR